jgi:hypothetical protein
MIRARRAPIAAAGDAKRDTPTLPILAAAFGAVLAAVPTLAPWRTYKLEPTA